MDERSILLVIADPQGRAVLAGGLLDYGFVAYPAAGVHTGLARLRDVPRPGPGAIVVSGTLPDGSPADVIHAGLMLDPQVPAILVGACSAPHGAIFTLPPDAALTDLVIVLNQVLRPPSDVKASATMGQRRRAG
jgi:hypothetical protein